MCMNDHTSVEANFDVIRIKSTIDGRKTAAKNDHAYTGVSLAQLKSLLGGQQPRGNCGMNSALSDHLFEEWIFAWTVDPKVVFLKILRSPQKTSTAWLCNSLPGTVRLNQVTEGNAINASTPRAWIFGESSQNDTSAII